MGPQKVSGGDDILLGITENTGEPGNPFSVLGTDSKTTTNFRSSLGMRGLQIHGDFVRSSKPASPVTAVPYLAIYTFFAKSVFLFLSPSPPSSYPHAYCRDGQQQQRLRTRGWKWGWEGGG